MSLADLVTSSLGTDVTKADGDILASSFFAVQGRQLPHPSDITTTERRGVVRLPELGLLVKYGPEVTVDEAITIWAMRRFFGSQLRVPELYGWRTDRGLVFVYMELILGMTLQQRMEAKDLSEPAKASICLQLSRMIESLRQYPYGIEGPFIGSISRQPLLDRVFYCRPAAGPFDNLQQFYAWMEYLPQRFLEPSQRCKDPYLEYMPEDSQVVFTHADLHPSNIMVSAEELPSVVAIIDWGQSGWYPDWWEYFKMRYTVHWDGDWCKNWIPKIIEQREDEQYLMSEYSMTIGAV